MEKKLFIFVAILILVALAYTGFFKFWSLFGIFSALLIIEAFMYLKHLFDNENEVSSAFLKKKNNPNFVPFTAAEFKVYELTADLSLFDIANEFRHSQVLYTTPVEKIKKVEADYSSLYQHSYAFMKHCFVFFSYNEKEDDIEAVLLDRYENSELVYLTRCDLGRHLLAGNKYYICVPA